MDIDVLNQQIKNIQKMLEKNKSTLSEFERIALYDTLTFLLDSRALIMMKGVREQSQEEKN